MFLPCLTLPQLEFGARCEGRKTHCACVFLECRTEVRMRGGTFLSLRYGGRFAKNMLFGIVLSENIIYLVNHV